jgi:hypothetical protein
MHGSHVTPVHSRTLRRRSATCNWPFAGVTLAVRQVADSLLRLTSEGTISDVGPEKVYRQLGLLWVYWVSPDKWWNSKNSWATATCSHVLSESWSNDHSTIRRCRIWATGSVINSVKNPVNQYTKTCFYKPAPDCTYLKFVCLFSCRYNPLWLYCSQPGSGL